MKLNRPSLIFLFIFFFCFSPIKAAHIIGGEVLYKCIGNNNYEFTMKVYRDCLGGGANFDSDPGSFTVGTVTIYEGNSTTPFITPQGGAMGTINLSAPIIQELQVVYPDPCLSLIHI